MELPEQGLCFYVSFCLEFYIGPKISIIFLLLGTGIFLYYLQNVLAICTVVEFIITNMLLQRQKPSLEYVKLQLKYSLQRPRMNAYRAIHGGLFMKKTEEQ